MLEHVLGSCCKRNCCLSCSIHSTYLESSACQENVRSGLDTHTHKLGTWHSHGIRSLACFSTLESAAASLRACNKPTLPAKSHSRSATNGSVSHDLAITVGRIFSLPRKRSFGLGHTHTHQSHMTSPSLAAESSACQELGHKHTHKL